MDISAYLPWTAWVCLAILAYGMLHYLAIQPAIPFILPTLLLLGAVLSFIRGQQTGDLPAAQLVSREPDVLESMSRPEFDALVAKAFQREGYLVVERASGQADRGVDLELFMGRDRYLVQCRRWKESKVDVALVRELYRAISTERAVGGFIVTSGKFTDEARALALGRSIRLVPADSLRAMLASEMTISPEFSRRRNDPVPPACPRCGKAMMSRGAEGGRPEELFWGCTSFPACQGSRAM